MLKHFLQLESASGIILFIASVIAIIWANSPFAASYITLFSHDTILFSVNEGLMSFFFLLVGLELKRSFLEGKFSHLSEILVPSLSALGGMIIPALIYVAWNINHDANLAGWSIPVATDIAFALGVLSLFGKRVPLALKLFLLALAIFDDIGAIIIIAIFYASELYLPALFVAILLLSLLFVINRLGSQQMIIYLALGVMLWFAIHKSGIHPTIAGILLALLIPYSTLTPLEKGLHPWVAYFIMPVFALANAGISFNAITIDTLTSTVVLGIASGLFLGKQIGICGVTWALSYTKFGRLPKNTTWMSFYGVAILCGIGFTMSLFLGTLSFQNESMLNEVRLGVIAGSLLSGICGSIVLMAALPRQESKEESID